MKSKVKNMSNDGISAPKWYLEMLRKDMEENGAWLKELTEELKFIRLNANQQTNCVDETKKVKNNA
jgi:hypothetical protein